MPRRYIKSRSPRVAWYAHGGGNGRIWIATPSPQMPDCRGGVFATRRFPRPSYSPYAPTMPPVAIPLTATVAVGRACAYGCGAFVATWRAASRLCAASRLMACRVAEPFYSWSLACSAYMRSRYLMAAWKSRSLAALRILASQSAIARLISPTLWYSAASSAAITGALSSGSP